MHKYTTEAINIRSYDLNDADKILVMYSKDKGIIRAVAKNAKKTKSSIGGRADLLVANKLLIGSGKNLDRIFQAEAVETFKNLRKDYKKLSYAMYCAEVINNFGMGDDINSESIYNLFLKTLNHISQNDNSSKILYSVLVFQLKMLEISGFGIELEDCTVCHNIADTGKLMFNSNAGGIVCDRCTPISGTKTISETIRCVLASIQSKSLTSSTMPKSLVDNDMVLNYCFGLLREFSREKSERKFKSESALEFIS